MHLANKKGICVNKGKAGLEIPPVLSEPLCFPILDLITMPWGFPFFCLSLLLSWDLLKAESLRIRCYVSVPHTVFVRVHAQ